MGKGKDKEGRVQLGEVCEGIFAWARVMSQLSDEEFGRAQGALTVTGGSSSTAEARPGIRPQDVLGVLPLWMMKSNLLFRLIYLGEPLRTEKCPYHEGHWSGCVWDSWYNPKTGERVEGYCDCQKVIVDGKVYVDSNVTGWLLDGNPEPNGQCGGRSIMNAPAKDYVQVCTGISGHSGACEWSPWFHYLTGKGWKGGYYDTTTGEELKAPDA